jgi:hypothetical protein
MMNSLPCTLIRWELRYFLLNPRQVLLFPLVLAGILLAMWPSIGSPFVPVFLVVFLGTEREFNNILNRWPSQHEALLLFPVRWRGVILAKNLATMLITLLVAGCASIIILYFAPETPPRAETYHALVYLPTVLFPLLAAGNARSLHSPRAGRVADLDDLPEALISVVVLGAASIPFAILWGVLESGTLTLLYSAATAVYWITVSVPRTARAVASPTTLRRILP